MNRFRLDNASFGTIEGKEVFILGMILNDINFMLGCKNVTKSQKDMLRCTRRDVKKLRKINRDINNKKCQKLNKSI